MDRSMRQTRSGAPGVRNILFMVASALAVLDRKSVV